VQPAGEVSFRINTMRNAGLRESRTGRVILLDADHVPAPTHIEAHMAMLDNGPKAMSTGPRLESANADGSGPVNFMWGHEAYSSMSPGAGRAVPFWGLVPGSNLGVHRAFAEEIGLFDTQYDGAYGYDDQDFNCRADRKGAVYYGDFRAYVIHLPHETIFGNREGSRNAALFEQKNGFPLQYPPFVALSNYGQNWAKRYAMFLAGRILSGNDMCACPPPSAGEPCKAVTAWASTNVGGRFLIGLAAAKLRAKIGRWMKKA
jgi:GT2 family glycosyltransferase